ncbi:putative acid phosphatase [Aspergillus heteromorphus CBS 117.55]|uniref:Putative acid phosphatase n=1 Tax=Aspergillus heteromorphus CBS 117.55 TaxID=1448321 RepID=A0A317VDK7_9EURO|nr:putative acid phosphatase [Aspergillus heteromorphus CBS 117.55]PWY72366.1 putative acid phosphatase [Aspergillus heteromorphus CBS 117.55]
MHILVVNDDGPPSSRLSPYIQPLVAALEAAGHRISVAIPSASRSWIGKAHLIEASLKATYVPPSAFLNDGTWASSPSTLTPSTDNNATDSDWVILTNGTPASCVQLGLHNLFTDRPPIDLVISGPNHGRNASTIYNLSSGTVGGALEAATCGKRGIAISFGSKDEQPLDIIHAAARLAVRVVDHLIANWDDRVELYNVNVPMRIDVEERPVLWTRTLPYYWSRGCLYAEVGKRGGEDGGAVLGSASGSGNADANGVGGEEEEEEEEEGNRELNGDGAKVKGKTASAASAAAGSYYRQREFAWGAELSDMKKALQASEEGTDAHTVLNGSTSVTALRANFWHVPGLEGPLVLDA